jgi:mycofactocin precursor
MQTSDERGAVLAAAPEILDQAIEIALDAEVGPDLDLDAVVPAEEVAADDTGEGEPPAILEEVLIEEVSIDGMCGVY